MVYNRCVRVVHATHARESLHFLTDAADPRQFSAMRYNPHVNYQPAIDVILAALPDVEAIYVFGSRARDDARSDSDVDLAVLPNAPLGPVARFDLQEQIASRLHCDIDLVDLRAASTVMCVQVLEHGIVLYERNAGRRQAFEATALSAYARLNEERRGIVDDIQRRGHVHG